MEERLKTYLRPGEQVRWQGRPAPFSLLEAEAKKQILLKWGLTVALGGGLLAVYLSRTEAPSMGFIGLVLLMIVVIIVGKIMTASQKKKAQSAAPAAAPVAAAAPAGKPAPGSAGEVKLYDVPDKEAAMLMAIVADKMQKPINELRFKSIKEVK